MQRQRWLVLVKPPDDHPGSVRASGPYYKREQAKAIVERVQAECDALAAIDDEAGGYAYLIPLERLGVRAALAWALRGERG